MTLGIEEDLGAEELIERSLLEALRAELPQAINRTITYTARKDRVLVGGVSGSTSYGWLLIKLLWVAEHYRGQGLGASLMQQIEGHGRALGCHGAWLDTSNPKACRFYKRLGYAEFGQLSNAEGQKPDGFKRTFLMKQL